MTRTSVLLAAILMMINAQAQERMPHNRQGEFFIDEIQGKNGGPNAFTLRHAARQSLPANIDNAFRAEAGKKAARSFEQIKFRGLSKGRQGVWQTVGPVAESDEGYWDPKNSSGRVTDLATAASCNDDKCRLYAATAGGGLMVKDLVGVGVNPLARRMFLTRLKSVNYMLAAVHAPAA
jgi:hypothetical protein